MDQLTEVRLGEIQTHQITNEHKVQLLSSHGPFLQLVDKSWGGIVLNQHQLLAVWRGFWEAVHKYNGSAKLRLAEESEEAAYLRWAKAYQAEVGTLWLTDGAHKCEVVCVRAWPFGPKHGPSPGIAYLLVKQDAITYTPLAFMRPGDVEAVMMPGYEALRPLLPLTNISNLERYLEGREPLEGTAPAQPPAVAEPQPTGAAAGTSNGAGQAARGAAGPGAAAAAAAGEASAGKAKGRASGAAASGGAKGRGSGTKRAADAQGKPSGQQQQRQAQQQAALAASPAAAAGASVKQQSQQVPPAPSAAAAGAAERPGKRPRTAPAAPAPAQAATPAASQKGAVKTPKSSKPSGAATPKSGRAAAGGSLQDLVGCQVDVPVSQWPDYVAGPSEKLPKKAYRGEVVAVEKGGEVLSVRVFSIHKDGRSGSSMYTWSPATIRSWLVPEGRNMSQKEYTAALHGPAGR